MARTHDITLISEPSKAHSKKCVSSNYSAAANSWIMNDNYLICSRSGNPPNKTSKTKLPHHRSPLHPTTFGANLSASGRQHFIRNIIHQHHGQFPNKMSMWKMMSGKLSCHLRGIIQALKSLTSSAVLSEQKSQHPSTILYNVELL